MENKLARFFRATGLARFLLPLGLVLIVMGAFLGFNAPKELTETVGSVTRSEAYQETDSDGMTRDYYEVFFRYTAEGKEYDGSFPGYDEPMQAGQELKVYFDSKDPKSYTNTKDGGLIGMVMMAAGVVILVLAVLSAVKAVKKQRALDQQIKDATGKDKVPTVTAPPKQELTEYYVLYDGHTFKPGYIMEDKNRSPVYRAEMTKNAVVGGRSFTFTNHKTGRSADHNVGHTVTQSFDDEFFSRSSWFKFDGENIWDLLHKKGVRIATDLRSRFPMSVYTVSVNGSFFATVENSGIYVHEEDAAQHKLNPPANGKYYYRCWTRETDMDLLFLVIFAISETEQPVVE